MRAFRHRGDDPRGADEQGAGRGRTTSVSVASDVSRLYLSRANESGCDTGASSLLLKHAPMVDDRAGRGDRGAPTNGNNGWLRRRVEGRVNQIVDDDAQTHDASALCVHSRLSSPVRLNPRARASGGVARRTRRRLAR